MHIANSIQLFVLHAQVITASEFHPRECNLFVYSSSKGTIRLCDMRQAALCDTHAKRKSMDDKTKMDKT